jgi:hypothetical protein
LSWSEYNSTNESCEQEYVEGYSFAFAVLELNGKMKRECCTVGTMEPDGSCPGETAVPPTPTPTPSLGAKWVDSGTATMTYTLTPAEVQAGSKTFNLNYFNSGDVGSTVHVENQKCDKNTNIDPTKVSVNCPGATLTR